MKIWATLPTALLVLASCVTAQERTQQLNAARAQQLETATRDCRPPRLKTNFEIAKCINDAEDRIYADAPHADLRQAGHAIALDIATKVDRGQISPEEGDAQIQLARVRLRTEAYQRDGIQAQAAAQVAAQNAATSAAFLNAAAAVQSNQPQPPVLTPMPSSVHDPRLGPQHSGNDHIAPG